MELAEQVAVCRRIPVMDSELTEDDTNLDPVQVSAHHVQQEVDNSGSEAGDIIRDAKLFQDAVTEYQLAYQSLDEKYTHQAILVKEASEALKASESHVSVLQEELMALKCNHEADIHQAVNQALLQYEHQLQSAQSLTHEHQTEIVQLQGQVQALQVTLASQKDLPSVPSASQEEADLREKVFNFVPGTVNTNRGTAVYSSPDQPFQFQKPVQFRDRSNQSDLESDVAGSGVPPSTTHLLLYSLTPFRRSSQVLLNQTFDVSGIPPVNIGNAQDAATIAAEVLAAAVAQASKEFWHMREPKITKLHGGYSADAELVFWSWRVDILANIQDRELDNKAAIQLIKEQTLDNARHEVEFQLDLCGGNITYQNLLRHLSITF